MGLRTRSGHCFRLLGACAALLSLAGCAANGELAYGASASAGGSVRAASTEGDAPGKVELGAMRLAPSVCEGVDLKPDYGTLSVDQLYQFLHAHSISWKTVEARGDLVYLDIEGHGSPIRLRVAILKNANDAGRELHGALLQHGPGSWGFHRANLAVLAPAGSLDDVIGFASKSQLACWGVLTVTGRDDTFVVPGGYTEI